MSYTTSPNNVILVFKIEPEYWQDQPYLKATQINVNNSDGKWALSGIVYEYAGTKSYLGLRDLLGVVFFIFASQSCEATLAKDRENRYLDTNKC